ncbi:MAG: hypothetical protein IJR17_00395 [Clostridia bacterium]|nr:hypothetical protein [Clostridia bacterium]
MKKLCMIWTAAGALLLPLSSLAEEAAQKKPSGTPLSLLLTIVLAGVLSVAVCGFIPKIDFKKKKKKKDEQKESPF